MRQYLVVALLFLSELILITTIDASDRQSVPDWLVSPIHARQT